MKKTIKYLVFSLFMLFGFSLNVNAETLPAAVNGKITLDKDYTVGTVVFDSTSETKVLDLNGKNLTVKSSIKVYKEFEIKNGTILRADSMISGPMLWIEKETANVTLNKVTLDGNKIECTGTGNFGIYSINKSSVTINNSTIKNNYNFNGGASSIYLVEANSLIVNNSKFENNKSSGDGGSAVYGKDLEKLYINNSIFENNETSGSGTIKGERIKDFIFDEHSVLRNNKASGGAGLHLSDVNAVISGVIEGNKSTDNGAGVYTLSNNDLYKDRIIRITSTAKIINNIADCAGGGLYVNSYKTNIPSKVIIEGATFSGNKSLGTVDASDGLFKDIGGGAIAVARGILEINDVKISNNTAAINKGNSIMVSHANGNANGGKLTINGGNFDNSIDLGTGTIVVNGGTFKQDMSKYITNKKLVSKKINDSYEVVENTTLKDENITFDNDAAMDNNYELVVTEKETDKELASDIKSVVKKEAKGAKDIKVLAMYDISVSDGTNPVEMKDGKFKITINLDEKLLKYNSYAGVYVDDEGKVTYVPVEVKDGKAVITTSHLSTYGVVGYNIPNPATNSNVEIIVSIILFALMFAGIGLSMKKQENNA